jgi:hypothetical protein
MTMHQAIRRFTRLTNAFSKKLDNLKAGCALHFAYYNFCRVHQTLRVTPAMEAGLTDHIWTLRELLQSAQRSSISLTRKPACKRVTCVSDLSRRVTLKPA